MINSQIVKFTSRINNGLSAIAGGFLILVLVWQCTFINGAAIASSLQPPSSSVIANFFNQAEGKVESATGTAQRNLGKVTGQAEGLSRDIQGRTKQDLSKAERTLSRAQNSVEEGTRSNLNQSKNALENTKNDFGNAVEDTKNNVGEAASNAVQNVKELFAK